LGSLHPLLLGFQFSPSKYTKDGRVSSTLNLCHCSCCSTLFPVNKKKTPKKLSLFNEQKKPKSKKIQQHFFCSRIEETEWSQRVNGRDGYQLEISISFLPASELRSLTCWVLGKISEASKENWPAITKDPWTHIRSIFAVPLYVPFFLCAHLQTWPAWHS
jgi:hypothetical protein